MNDKRDAESMAMELEEVAARDALLASMAGELAIAVNAAMRILVAVSDLPGVADSPVWRSEFGMVEKVADKLDELGF